jgi:hypothetical protein
MRVRPILVVAILISGLGGSTNAEQSAPPQFDREQFAAQSRPGEAHQRLAAMVGAWTFTIRYDAGPLGKGEETGTLDVRSSMDGRFFIEEAKTRFFGQRFEWIGIHGYDTQAKRYVSSWIDNLSTQIDSMTGRWSDLTRTLTYSGEADHPVEGKTVIGWSIALADDRMRVAMYEGVGAKRVKVMELDARRR